MIKINEELGTLGSLIFEGKLSFLLSLGMFHFRFFGDYGLTIGNMVLLDTKIK